MHDRTVRRRRAVLALLVALSLILLTAYFGQGRGGPLHAVQRGALEVLAPIQEGASRALKPVRDLAGWFSDTLHAKTQRDRLERENRALRREVIGAAQARVENAQLAAMVKLDRKGDLGAYRPLAARVTFRSPIVWSSTIQIDKGSSDGVRVDQPVIDGDGLVGKVTAVTANAAQVTLITDESSGVSAQIIPKAPKDGRPRPLPGIVQTAVGKPDDLLLNDVAHSNAIHVGQPVVTSGTISNRLESLYPSGIPIGEVASVDPQELNLYQRVHLRPYVDFRRLSFVQVLSQPHARSSLAE